MNEFTESSSEEIQNPEIPTGDWQTLIIIQRHGEYDNRRPADWQNLTSDEQKNLGRLTEKGKDKVTHISQERISAILEQNPEETDFILINSPTFWLDEPQFGQRARETAEIIGQTILASLGERGLNQNQLLNVRPKTSDHPFRFKGGISRPEGRAGEALMFQVPEFTQFLREQYGGQGEEFWKNFYKDTHQEKRKELGAEGPAEIAERMRQFLRVVNRFANYYHRRYPERRLVPWIVSHGECLSSLSQNITGLETGDIHFGYNEAVVITDRQNELEAQIKNQKYGISLR